MEASRSQQERPKRASLAFSAAAVRKTPLPDGGMILRSAQTLGSYPRCLGEHLRRWAAATPERTFLAERDGASEWRRVTYGRALPDVECIAQALLDRGLGPDRPVMLLSDNSVDNALLQLACMHVGIPVAPVSQAYSLVSQDHAKLRYLFDLVRPGLLYAASGKAFGRAFASLDLTDTEVVVSCDPPEQLPTTAFATLLATRRTSAVDQAFERVGPNTVAKILFTSGSTGMPKGVINTQRMLCSNQQAIAQVWPFLEEKPPVVLDWLPWNHTFGGNHNFNMVLRNGGALYVDGGKPVPGLIDKTVANLRDVSPTLYFNVPRGFDVLLPFLEADTGLRKSFFRDLDMIFYAAAALPQNLWERLEALSVAERGEKVVMTSAWGATETSPAITTVHFPIDRAGVIGLPVPGCDLKMVPNAGKLEMRVRGPNVTPGYFKQDDLTAASFDEEGFYLIGDAGKLADPDDPARGVVFDGRVAEDFKLTTGTWVHVGGVRVGSLEATAPLLQDAVVTGHNRDYLGLLAWPNVEACRKLVGDAELPLADLLASRQVVAGIRNQLRARNQVQKGSSARVERVVLMTEPPDIDANEITDKGYINQRATLERRAALVEKLYAEPPADGVIVI